MKSRLRAAVSMAALLLMLIGSITAHAGTTAPAAPPPPDFGSDEVDPAMTDDGEMAAGALLPGAGKHVKGKGGSGDMNVRSGSGCEAVFDQTTNTRLYICTTATSEACTELTDEALRNRPGAKYRFSCPAPNKAEP
jgi:hypothetical protein